MAQGYSFFGIGRSSSQADRPERPRRSASSKKSTEDLRAKRAELDESKHRRHTYSGRSHSDRRTESRTESRTDSRTERRSESRTERRKESSSHDKPRRSSRRMDDPTSRTVTVTEYPKRRPSTSSASSSRHSRSYVYGTQFPAKDPLVPMHTAARNLDDEREPSVRSSRSRRSAEPSLADSLPGLSELEVTPDDSISQVASRGYKQPRPRKVVR
jgi:hypothetical protein